MSREVCGICWCPYDEFTGDCACPPASVQKSTLREAAQQALEKLEFFAHMKGVSEDTARLIAALRAALAEPVQERKPLTEEEIDRITRDRWGAQLLGVMVQAHREYARAIEAAHGIK